MKVVVGLGNPGDAVREDAPQHRLDGPRPGRRPRGLVGARPHARRSAVAQGRYRGLDLVLVKPLTYMNDSGIAVRKLLARERAPLHEILVVTDDFSPAVRQDAVPRGRQRRRPQRPALDHRRAATPSRSPRCASASASRVGTPSTTSSAVSRPTRGSGSTNCSTLRPTRSRPGPATATSKAANRFNAFELRPADETRTAPPGEVDGPPGPDGVRRTRTGWRRVRPADEAR